MSRPRVLVGCDFDGTIAPLVDHPDLSVADERAVGLLEDLASTPGVDVVIVSGRSLESLRTRIGEIRDVSLIGEHGNDVGEARDVPAQLLDAIEHVRALTDELPGSHSEVKRASVTFHTRNVDPDAARLAQEGLRRWAASRPSLEVIEGKDVIEVTSGSLSKGDVMLELGRTHDGTVFIGDDRTDETVFMRLGPNDLGVKVGEGETLAPYRVPDVAAVADLLATMLEAREATLQRRGNG